VLKRSAAEFPAVVLTGPRQSGKATLLKELFKGSHRYVSLELPDIRAAASVDPRGFLELNPAPVIFDEVQYCPDLLPYIKDTSTHAAPGRDTAYRLTKPSAPIDGEQSHHINPFSSSHSWTLLPSGRSAYQMTEISDQRSDVRRG